MFMNIISAKDLTQQGLSDLQIKKDLQIKCFDKIFERSSDLPKKFKTKAIGISHQLTKKGIQSFITETSYCYTVWKESI